MIGILGSCLVMMCDTYAYHQCGAVRGRKAVNGAPAAALSPTPQQSQGSLMLIGHVMGPSTHPGMFHHGHYMFTLAAR